LQNFIYLANLGTNPSTINVHIITCQSGALYILIALCGKKRYFIASTNVLFIWL